MFDRARGASSQPVPPAADIVVIGAGVHGLSTACYLSDLLRREGSSKSLIVLDKGRVGSGASGISGGIVRNFYLSEAMNELVRQSVEIFELDPQLFGFRQVGYMAVVPECQAEELEKIARQQAAIGYSSELVQGSAASFNYMRAHFADWTAEGAAAVLKEKRSGWADARRTLDALAGIARAEGVRILESVEVVGFELASGAVSTVETTAGSIACDVVVLAPGPWAGELWQMLELPASTSTDDGAAEPIFHYWGVREGEFVHSHARLPEQAPVVHLDVDQPLVSPADGATLLEPPWGVYFRPSLGPAVACGGLPVPLASDVELDPYGPSHAELGGSDPAFVTTSSAALSWALGRFGDIGEWTVSAFGAPTCFTPDSHPIVGFVCENVYALIDSNHGFKLLALGKLAASEIASDKRYSELDPFRMDRFEARAVHPVSASPYPWT
jgi:glycine/D-amino acid oxidase-like deaminating enzyme